MKRPNELNLYTIEFSISGINWNTDPDADQKFMEEIKMRPHLKVEAITIKEDKLFIKLTAEGPDRNMTSKQTAEELFEISNAVLNEVEGLSVEINESKT
jgi:hypothetical protein